MKVEYRTEVQSTAERLWELLTDVQAWPESQGTTCVEAPTGPLEEGSCFVARGGGFKWNITVMEADRPNRVVWEGKRVGLKAVHEWEFVEAAGKTQVLNGETMSGWMLPLIYPLAKSRLASTDEKWLGGLKSRAESS